MNYIRKTHLWHIAGMIYLDLGYMLLNTFINHIPAWWLRKLLYRAAGMKIGKHCRIGIGTIIVKPHGICLGEGCIVNEYCHLDGRGGLTIGDHTSISIYTKIITASHDINSESFAYQSHEVTIGDHVFIGAGVIILEKSILGKGCVVGAGAVVKGVLECNGIYIGNPVKKVGNRVINNSYELYHDAYFR